MKIRARLLAETFSFLSLTGCILGDDTPAPAPSPITSLTVDPVDFRGSVSCSSMSFYQVELFETVPSAGQTCNVSTDASTEAALTDAATTLGDEQTDAVVPTQDGPMFNAGDSDAEGQPSESVPDEFSGRTLSLLTAKIPCTNPVLLFGNAVKAGAQYEARVTGYETAASRSARWIASCSPVCSEQSIDVRMRSCSTLREIVPPSIGSLDIDVARELLGGKCQFEGLPVEHLEVIPRDPSLPSRSGVCGSSLPYSLPARPQPYEFDVRAFQEGLAPARWSSRCTIRVDNANASLRCEGLTSTTLVQIPVVDLLARAGKLCTDDPSAASSVTGVNIALETGDSVLPLVPRPLACRSDAIVGPFDWTGRPLGADGGIALSSVDSKAATSPEAGASMAAITLGVTWSPATVSGGARCRATVTPGHMALASCDIL